MKVFTCVLGSAVFALAGCTEFAGQTGSASDGVLMNVPEGVLSIAGPYQDLNAVRINPADGCYEYRHSGPVETTFLPLRSTAGNPICSRPPVAAG